METLIEVNIEYVSDNDMFDPDWIAESDLTRRGHHWYVGIAMSIKDVSYSHSIHQFEFKCKPTRKQLSVCLRQAHREHEEEWAEYLDILDYHYSKGLQVYE